MINVFKKLEMQSKSTGLSVSQLLGIAGEQFDTFEGSAKSVGKLNAILGGPYLNSIDMLNMKEDERIEAIKASIEASGVQFDQLSKYEQKNMAQAMSTDVDTLRRMMGAMTDEEERAAMTKERLAEKAGDARDVMAKLKDAINGIIIRMDPLITKFSKWANNLPKHVKAINKFINKAKIAAWIVGGTLLFAVSAVVYQFWQFRNGLRAIAAQAPATAMAIQQIAAATAELAAANAANRAAGGAPMGGGMGGMGGGGMGGGMGGGGMGGGMGGAGRKMPFGARMPTMRAALGGAALMYAGSKLRDAGEERKKIDKNRKAQLGGGMSTAGYAASGAGIGLVLGSIFPGLGNALGAAIGGLAGAGYGLFKNVNWTNLAYEHPAARLAGLSDGVVHIGSDGKATTTKFSSQDDVKMTFKKPGGPLDNMERSSTAALTRGPSNDEMLAELRKLTAAAESSETQGSGAPPEVKVFIGDKELTDQIVTAMDSEPMRNSLLPWAGGN
jgi:hypothetical protein